MTVFPIDVPPLADNDVHLWRCSWSGGAGEARFAALLAAYTAPSVPSMVRGPHGKPRFDAPFSHLGFNWSHSGDVAVLAVGRGPADFEIGVDVERVRPRTRALELAERFFAPAEAETLRALPTEDQLAGFLRLWTVKEAVLKAHGGGLSYGLHRAAFVLDAEGVARPSLFEGEIAPAESWTVQPLSLGDDLVAALAWRGGARSVQVFTSPL